jgi:predicted negative regulator of RcsB-dependent stress response
MILNTLQNWAKRLYSSSGSDLPLAFSTRARDICPLFMDSAQTEAPSMIKLMAWVEVNKRRLVVAVGVAVVVIALAVVVVHYQLEKEVRASEALSDVRASLNLNVAPPPGLPEAYLKVAAEHAGTKAAERALALAGAAFYLEGQYAEAQKQFERLPREYPDSPWAPQAAVGVAACLDAQQKIPEAINKYEEVRKRYASDPISDEVKLSLGRLYDKQGKGEEAYKLYEDVMKSGMAMQSGLAMEAGARSADLVKRFPDLIKPKMPVMPAAVPSLGTNQAIPGLKGTNAAAMSLQRATSTVPSLTITARPPANVVVPPPPNATDKK